MQLLVGLGNPGKAYETTRHNIGFGVIDAIADRYGFPVFKQKFSGLLSEGVIGPHKVTLFKPQTFMNRSGQAVVALLQFYKLSLEQVTVIHDELDLVIGKIRVKRGGSPGGHNGLKSIDSHTGQDYTRLRIGINHPGDRDMVADYVLAPFTKQEQTHIDLVVQAITQHIELLLNQESDHFMSKVAHLIQPSKEA